MKCRSIRIPIIITVASICIVAFLAILLQFSVVLSSRRASGSDFVVGLVSCLIGFTAFYYALITAAVVIIATWVIYLVYFLVTRNTTHK